MSLTLTAPKPPSKKDNSLVEYVPHGGSAAIKLSISLVQNLVAVRTKTGRTCSERDALRFIAMCSAKRLNPFEGDAFLVGYDAKDGQPVFSLITAHQAFLKRAESHTQYKGMKSGVILLNEDGRLTDREGDFALPNENVVGGWAVVERENRIPTVRRLSMEAMKPEYPTHFWSKAKAPGQLVKCAEADALRSTFPTLLGGLYTHEELSQHLNAHASALTLPDTVPVIPEPPEAPPEAAGNWPAPEDEGDLGPTAPAAPPAPTPPLPVKTPQQDLAEVILAGGFNFDNFARWCELSGNLANASSVGGFDEVPAGLCKRLLNNKAGLLDGLKRAKGTVGP